MDAYNKDAVPGGDLVRHHGDAQIMKVKNGVLPHFYRGGNGFDQMKLAHAIEDMNRNWCSKFLGKLLDYRRQASD